MSYIGEMILKRLVSLRKHSGRAGANSSPDEEWQKYIRWQFDSSAQLFAKYPHWDITGKTVLEIGCGTGGRAAYLATAGACRVVAIDINREEIEVANRFCSALYPQIAGRVEYLTSAENTPLDVGQFDVVLLVDAMEHVVSPPNMMQLAYEYTSPGGQFYFSSIGWYHHQGSHTGILPFANVLFSDETILNVMRWWVSRPEYVPGRFDSDPPIERWCGLYNLRDRPGEHLNKITIREMKKLVKHSRFSTAHLHVIGFGQKHPIFRLLAPLRNIPLIQEVCHSVAIAECRR
jgi:2-polyprenyl-3-methyl-5-hydroxy-6-metoxy-1,4-benzoquinol methylase